MHYSYASGERSPLRTLIALIQLTRPLNCLICFFSVIVGAAASGTIASPLKAIVAAFSATLIAAAGNGFNDLSDVEADRIDKPHRPIPSEVVTKRTASIQSTLLFIGGMLLSFLINKGAVVVVFATTLLLIQYSIRLKSIPLVGNFTVSCVAALAFVYGGLSTGSIYASFIPALFAILFHLGREIIKDVEDIQGDMHSNYSTFPVIKGKKAAFAAATAVYTMLMLLTLVPYPLRIYGSAYLVIVVVGVHPVLIYVIRSMWKDDSSANLKRLSTILKADMVVGLVAVLVGANV